MVTRDNGDGRQVDMFLRPEAPKHTPSLEQETLPSAVHRKPEVRAKFKELQGILDMPIAKILDLIPSTEIQQIPRVTLASIGLPQDISTQEQLERAKEEDEERPYVPRRTRPNAERPLDAHNTYEIRTPVAHVPSLKIIFFRIFFNSSSVLIFINSCLNAFIPDMPLK